MKIMEKLMKLGQQMMERREQLRLSQLDIAGIAGISDTTLRNIERGKPTVAFIHWINVADILGLDFTLMNKKMSDATREGIQ